MLQSADDVLTEDFTFLEPDQNNILNYKEVSFFHNSSEFLLDYNRFKVPVHNLCDKFKLPSIVCLFICIYVTSSIPHGVLSLVGSSNLNPNLP